MALIIAIKVVPSASKQQIVLDKSGILKCYLKSPPEDGKANKELIKLVSQQIGLPQANIQIVAGATIRNKKLKIETTMSYEQLLKACGCEVQNALF